MEHFWYLSMLMIRILAAINLSSADRQISFQFEGVDTSFLNRASDACIAIFTVNAPCPPLEDFSLDKDLSLETIEPNGLSQGACFSSLAGLRDSVKEQCGSNATYKAYSDDSIWKASYAMEEALYNVDRTCLREGDGQYCDTWFQVPRKGVPFCDERYKIILWHNTPSLLPGGPTSYNCYNKQPNNPPFLIPSPPPTQTCSSKHTLKAGDTFLSLDDYIRAEDAPYVPIANGTRTDCWHYLWWNEKKMGSSYSCLDAAEDAEISLEQFFLWNPSLNQNITVEGTPTHDFPCTISPYVSYCMQLESPTPTPKKPFIPPSPRAEGEIANCIKWFYAYFDCSTQLKNSKMSMQLMYRYNPSLKEDCSGYTLGTYYCHETLEDYHGYGLRREDVSKSKPYQYVPTAAGTSSSTAQPTDIF